MKFNVWMSALLLAASGVSMAQPATPKLDQREVNQQKRIDQGSASGQLTTQEANRLEKRDAKLAANEAAAKSDGIVTKKERRKLQREADRNSAVINKAKHNGKTATN